MIEQLRRPTFKQLGLILNDCYMKTPAPGARHKPTLLTVKSTHNSLVHTIARY